MKSQGYCVVNLSGPSEICVDTAIASIQQVPSVELTFPNFPTDGGDGELRTFVHPSNLAPIATKNWQRAFQTICKFRFFIERRKKKMRKIRICFSLFSADFRRARLFLKPKSNSSRFFALDGQIFRSVRRLELIFGFFTVRTSTRGEIYGGEQERQGMGARHGRCGGKARVTEIPGGRSPPDPPRGAIFLK